MQNGPAGQVDGVCAADVPDSTPDFATWLDRARLAFENRLSEYLRGIESELPPHSRLPAAVLYAMRVGGKRLRPILVLETCRLCDGRPEAALPAALALEFVHTFSLIHDDLPAMDNDDLRRGQPTCHKVYGDAQAILAGDWLATRAFGLLATTPLEGTALRTVVAALARGTERMIEGQGADIDGEGRPASAELVRYIHQNKTAALLETCCRLGSACAGAAAEVIEHMAEYGRRLGLAFQIADDLLDETSTTERLGKAVHKDAAVAKQTYPAVFGMAESRAQAQREIEAALAALTSFGPRADRLRDLARYVVQRDH